MNLVQSLLVNNPCYKANKKIEVKGATLHSVGCAQPDAKVFVKNWNKESYSRACVHGFIDANDGTVYQCLPWNHRGWHAGGSANNTHIGVEMCETKGVRYDKNGKLVEILDYDLAVKNTTTTYNSAVELFAMLCKTYNLDPLKKGVIVSHSEAHTLGMASNHGDPEHLWKFLKLPYTMDSFRRDVAAKMGKVSVVTTSTPSTDGSFKVKCLDNMNIRSEPRVANGNIVMENGCKKGGVYTIVETNGNWGLLKSFASKRNGWINISNKYATRL